MSTRPGGSPGPQPSRPKESPRPTPPTKKFAAIHAASRHLAMAAQDLAGRSPHESALAAHWSGGPSVEELEARISQLFATAA